MKYTAEDMQYISGKKFSNGYLLKLTENALYNRIRTIVNLVAGSRVIHVGCCDHLPLIEDKIRSHIWLQGILDEKCEDVLGIDIDEEAVNFVNNSSFAKQEVLCGDITSRMFCSKLDLSTYDYIIMGEILEHINNPVIWLNQVNINMKDSGFKGKFIITVPNALSRQNTKHIRRKTEVINSDHRYWFTPYTLAKVCYEAGIVPEELLFAGGRSRNFITRQFFRCLAVVRREPSSYKAYEGDRREPSSYKAYEGDDLVFIGKSMWHG